MVHDFVTNIATLDSRSPEFAQKAESIRTMGDADIRAASAVSNRMLEAPVRAMSARWPRSGVERVEGVDRPAPPDRRPGSVESIGGAQAARRHPVRRQAARLLRSLRGRAVAHQRDPERSCTRGQDELRKDNAALEQEKVHLWETMQRLAQYVYIAEHLDTSMTRTGRSHRGVRPETREDVARRRPLLHAPEAPGSADAARGVDPGLPRDRSHPPEQHRADQGCRPGHDHHDRGACALR